MGQGSGEQGSGEQGPGEQKIGKDREEEAGEPGRPGGPWLLSGTEFPEEALWALWGVDARQD